MDRRDFIKQGCYACMALGAGIAISSLSSCITMPMVKTDVNGNKISIDRASFTDGAKAILVRTKKMDYDILLVKTETSYRALYMECTHNQTSLSCNQKQIFCPLHGAEFDFEGNVIKGPADKNLKTFPVMYKDNNIIISL